MKTKLLIACALLINAIAIKESSANGNLPTDNSVNLSTIDRISAGNLTELNSVSQFTIEFKVKSDSYQRFTKILSKQLNRGNRIQIQVDGGRVVAVVANGNNAYRQTVSNVISTGKWHHIAVVFNGNEISNANRLKVYVDGIQKTLIGTSNIPATTANTTSAFSLGGNKFNGQIDELRVWESALSQDDISLWRQRRLNTTHTNFNELRLYWQFDDAASISLIKGQLNTGYDGSSTTVLSFNKNKTFNIYAYLPSYRIAGQNADAFDHVTHVVYKSVKPMSDGSIHPNLNGNPAKALVATTLNTLKDKVADKPVQVLLGVGGGHASGNAEFIPSIAATAALRNAFSEHLKEYCFANGLNGVDINWEFPQTATELANWKLLVQAVYNTFNPEGLLVTASYRARNGSFSYIPLAQTVDLAVDSQDYLDLFSVQVYNRYDVFGNHVTYDTYLGLTDDYAGAVDMDKSKLLSAAAFYGRGVVDHSKVMKYKDIINKTGNAAGVESITGPDDDVVYNHIDDPKASIGNYSFNGVNTNVKKANYIYDEALNGLMLWELGQDVAPSSEYSLVKAINEVLPIDRDKLPPTPGFQADAEQVVVGSTVNYTDTSSHVPTSWAWSFPGASPSVSTTQNPSVNYSSAGTYPVTLTVTNSAGTKTITRTSLITVSN